MDGSRVTSEKRQKFVSLAEKRTQDALNAIRKIGNLSNKRSYEWSAADVKKIKKALNEALNDMERKFDPNHTDKQPVFRL